MERTFQIRAIDHRVLVALSTEATVEFYTRVLGLEAREMVQGRLSLHFGCQKINLQELRMSVDRNTRHPSRGAGDFCSLTDTAIDAVADRWHREGVKLVSGPIARARATGRLRSVYFYDPDEKLVEMSNLTG